MNKVNEFTLRRDKNGPLRFKGERIGSAIRDNDELINEKTGEPDQVEISIRLFKTTGGKFVLGLEAYNHTQESYAVRLAWIADSLEELLEQIKPESTNHEPCSGWADRDMLGEVFEDTEVGTQFVELIE